MSAETIIGIDVSRDWLDGFCLPGKQRFRLQNSPDGYARLLETLQSMPDGLKVGFETTGGQEWALWRVLISMGIKCGPVATSTNQGFRILHGEESEDRPDRRGTDCALHGCPPRGRPSTAR